MTVEECAQHIINKIKPYHQHGIEIIGDKTQIIHRQYEMTRRKQKK